MYSSPQHNVMYPPLTPAFQLVETNQTLSLHHFGVSSCHGTWFSVGDDADINQDLSDSNASLLPASTAASLPWFKGPLDPENAFRLVVDVGLITSLCLFGFIGNALTIATLRQSSHNRNRTTNWLLQVLALLDIVYLATALLMHPYRTLRELTTMQASTRSSAVGSVVLQLIMPYIETAANILRSLTRTAIVWLVVLVTLDRYMAVCKPLLAVEVRTLRHAHKAVIGVLGAAVLYNLPKMFEIEISIRVDPCTNRSVSESSKTPFANNKVYFLVYQTIFYVVFRSVGPLVLLIVLNARLAAALRLVRHRRRLAASGSSGASGSGGAAAAAGSGRGGSRRRPENLTLMLVVVVSVFVVCELPDVILRLTVAIFEFENRMSFEEAPKKARYVLVVCNALHAVNSSVNFIIYCLLGSKFRRLLRQRLADLCNSSLPADHGGSGAVDGRRPWVATTAAITDNAAASEAKELRYVRVVASSSKQIDTEDVAVSKNPTGNQVVEDVNVEIVVRETVVDDTVV